VRRVAYYALAPGHCLTCPSSSGPGIDLEREIGLEWMADARIYLCDDCAREIARLCNFPSPQEVIFLRAEKQRLDTDVDELTARAEQAEAELRDLHGAIEVIQRVGPDPEPDPEPEPEPRVTPRGRKRTAA
jgi:hypothetical protein